MGFNLPVNVAEAQLRTLQDISATGAPLGEATDPKGSVELLGYSTGMSNPLARVAVGMNTVGAVARFVWLVSGSDRLEDIAYYESKARTFTDDGLSMPGSSYGKRIFNAAPGLNQMRGLVDELRSDRKSRRAAAVVWLPEDAIRHQSNDIPCTFGLFFHIRDGGLIMTTVMRSNNAVVLLPYNFFEFSMVGELVAAELDVPFARYVHWAASMHTVNKFDGARDTILSAGSSEALTMPAMPRGEALESAYALARFETELRHSSTADELKETAARARAELDQYWLALFNVLYVYGLAKREFRELAKEEFNSIPNYFKEGAHRASEIRSLFDTEPLNVDTADDSLFVYDIEPLSPHAAAALVARSASMATDAEWLLQTLREVASDQDVSLDDVIAVQENLSQRDVTLASRGAGESEALTASDVADALTEVRKNKGL